MHEENVLMLPTFNSESLQWKSTSCRAKKNIMVEAGISRIPTYPWGSRYPRVQESKESFPVNIWTFNSDSKRDREQLI